MKSNTQYLLIIIILALTSCGSLKLNVVGCETSGQWGEKPMPSNESASPELLFSEEYYLFGRDVDVNLKDFLLEQKMDCHEIKKLRVQIESTFFVKRKLVVFIKK